MLDYVRMSTCLRQQRLGYPLVELELAWASAEELKELALAGDALAEQAEQLILAKDEENGLRALVALDQVIQVLRVCSDPEIQDWVGKLRRTRNYQFQMLGVPIRTPGGR